MNMNCGCNSMEEKKKLLHEIGMVDFVIVEMTEYLDTHPHDKQGIEYFDYYAKMKDVLMKEFAEKYYPLSLSTAESSMSEWKWALQNPPWEGGQ